MKKIISIILCFISIICLFGCKHEDEVNKIYLSDKYYESSEYIKIKAEDFDKIEDSTYVVYTYNSYCSLKIPCENIFKEVMDKYNISFYSLAVQEMKKTFIYDTVKYAPSVIIINNGEIVAYLDAESDDDLDKYQDAKDFERWLGKYIYLEK